MHLVIIIAFASLLWFDPKQPRNLLGLTPYFSVLLVVGQVLLISGAAVLATLRTRRLLLRMPHDPDEAHHFHHLSGTILQFIMLGFFVANLLLTAWPRAVTRMIDFKPTFGLEGFIILLPFLVTIVLVWIVQYPADRDIRRESIDPKSSDQPRHVVWGLWQYLQFNIRYQLLTVATPMALIIISDDVVNHYRKPLQLAAGNLLGSGRVYWVPDALIGLLVCAIFLFAPVMLRFLWSTDPIPPGSLRSSLERIAQKMGLKYREILVWNSGGMVVNAAVMGLIAPVRYVLISDGLLESMSEKHIQAVFGHEGGHVKYRHIQYFIVFTTLTMLIAGGLMHLLRATSPLSFVHVQIIVGFVVVVIWGVAFGWLSHQFEYQADISGAMCIAEESGAGEGHDSDGERESTSADSPLCIEAAEQFGSALRRVAALNGIPPDERGWRHPSIRKRVRFLKEISQDPALGRKFMNLIKTVKLVLVIGTLIGLAGGAVLYWDFLWPFGGS